MTASAALLLAAELLAQRPSGPELDTDTCTVFQSPPLLDVAKAKVGSYVAFPLCETREALWASSSLKPDGKEPRPATPKPDLGDGPFQRLPKDVQNAYHLWLKAAKARHGWSCRYTPLSAIDRDPRTAWCEGVAGDGVGEVLMVPIIAWRPVHVQVGVAATPALFRANGRPTRARLSIVVGEARHEGPPGWQAIARCWTGVRKIATRDVDLEDVDAVRMLKVPEVSEDLDDTFLVLEVLSVTPGEKFHDTCITELGNEPPEP